MIGLQRSRITGTLNMSYIGIDQSLLMSGSQFDNVELGAAHVGGRLDLNGSKVIRMLNMGGLQVGQNLTMAEKAKFGNILMRNVHVAGQLALIRSEVTGKINMQGLQADHGVIMRETKLDVIDLQDAHIRGSLDLEGSKVTGTLSMEGLQVDEDLLMQGETELHKVVLRDAHVGGQLDFINAKVGAMLDMNDIRVNHSLVMRGAEFGEVSLLDAHVGGLLDLRGSIGTTLDMDGLQVGELAMGERAQFGEVVLLDAHIGGQVDLSSSKVTGTLELRGIQVGSIAFLGNNAEFDGPIDFVVGNVGDVELTGGSFNDNVNFAGTQISGELGLGSSRASPTHWSPKSMLILRDTSVGEIQDLEKSWPNKLDLNGFTYRNWGGPSVGGPMVDRPADWFEGWLGKQASYTTAPYQQLASVLREHGQPDVADDVLYAGKERERAQSEGLRYIWLTANRLVIGYGYHVEWALIWISGFLLAGIMALSLTGEGCKNSMPYGIAYSFDMLLPIIRLREKHYQIDLGPVRYYFYLHKIAGFVLASFLIAGLSGLTLTR